MAPDAFLLCRLLRHVLRAVVPAHLLPELLAAAPVRALGSVAARVALGPDEGVRGQFRADGAAHAGIVRAHSPAAGALVVLLLAALDPGDSSDGAGRAGRAGPDLPQLQAAARRGAA